MLFLILESTTSHAQTSHHKDVIISFVSFTNGRREEGRESHSTSAMREPATLTCFLPM